MLTLENSIRIAIYIYVLMKLRKNLLEICVIFMKITNLYNNNNDNKQK